MLAVGCGATVRYGAEGWHLTQQMAKDLKAWEGRKARRMGGWRRRPEELHRGFMKRTEGMVEEVFDRVGLGRLVVRLIERQHNWAARVLQEELVAGVASADVPEPSPTAGVDQNSRFASFAVDVVWFAHRGWWRYGSLGRQFHMGINIR